MTWADMILGQDKSMVSTLGLSAYDSDVNPYGLPTRSPAVDGEASLLNPVYTYLGQTTVGILGLSGNNPNRAIWPKRPLFDDRLMRMFKTFAVAPRISVVPASGQYLQDLQVAYVELQDIEIRVENSSWFPMYPGLESTWDVPEQPICQTYFPTKACSVSPFPAAYFEKLCGLPEYFIAAADSVEELHKKVSAVLKDLLRGLRRQCYLAILSVEHLFFRPVPRFCGLGWSRRLWFLLHGSHPPKASTLLPA